MCYEAAQVPHVIDLSFNRFGLHEVGCEKMAAELQALVDSADDPKYDAILLGYGLCNNGIAGLAARSRPLVIPRGHDCITLLLDSKERYAEEFDREPGTYYHSPGWLEHHNTESDDHVMQRLGMRFTYRELVEKYGEENARYIQETMGSLGSYEENHTRMVYIDTGLGPREELMAESRRQAEKKNWNFVVMKSERALVRRLLSGDWDGEEFLVLQPGQAVQPSYDERVVKADQCRTALR